VSIADSLTGVLGNLLKVGSSNIEGAGGDKKGRDGKGARKGGDTFDLYHPFMSVEVLKKL
jgi:hypothetical protein